VPENTSGVIYTATATDPNNDPLTFALVNVLDAALFNFNPATRQLSFIAPPNFEGGDNDYTVRLSVDDDGAGGHAPVTQDVNILVTNVNEAPTMTLNPSGPITVPEGIAAGSTGVVLTDANATDPEGLGLTYSRSGVDGNLFIIDSDDGELRFLNSPNASVGDNNYTVTITASDGVNSVSQNFNVLVSALNGVTINGTGNADIINQTQTVAGQPLPTNQADTINGNGGNDTINALAGNDTIRGGAGADNMTGGLGNDVFVYGGTLVGSGSTSTLADSGPTAATRDTITDFVHLSDVINLSAIDARLFGQFGNQAFAFVAAQTTGTVANSVTWSQDAGLNQTIIRGDFTNNTTADFQIVLAGLHTLTAADFVL
jgi:Ca2+-binding RTX toxin-like protein